MTNREIEQLWQTYYPKIFGYFFRRCDCRQDVDDLTSLALGKFIDQMRKSKSQIEHPEAYLWKIAHHQLADFIKRKVRQPVTVPLDPDTSDIDQSLEQHRSEAYQERVKALMHCVQKSLRNAEFQIIQESILNDKKSTEVAEKLQLTPGNVRQKLSRTIQKLRQKCRQIWNHFEADPKIVNQDLRNS